MIERYLIKRIKEKSDKDAANKLINKYYKNIYLYVFKQVNNKEVSMDLTQEIFISMLKSIDGYEEKKSAFKTWIYKIASNKVIDYYRSKHYRYSTLTIELENVDTIALHNIEESFLIKESANEIIEIINRFEWDIQQILRLKIFGDMTFKEISTVLEIKESTAKTKYYSSIKKIRNMLEVSNDERRTV